MQVLKKTEYELLKEVQFWVDRTFNYINLQNAEKVFDNMLTEHIENIIANDTYALDFIHENSLMGEYKESELGTFTEFAEVEYEYQFHEYLGELENYPLWNTLFEFRENPSEETLWAARNKGMGIIESSESYNTMLFVKGAGYSFYAAHWIPMYLGLPWVDNEEYAGLEFGHL